MAVAAALALLTSGCAAGATSDQSADGGTLRYATVAEPVGLDPALVFDSDSYRINAQIFETLTTLAPGATSDVVPGLASKWTPNTTGTEWTFTLQKDVKFQDGTDFNADAVVTNFERWKNFPEALQGRAELIGTIFGGFGDASIVKSVEATDATTVVVRLSEPRPDLPIALTVPVFGIGSPTALKKYNADDASSKSSEFANAHPVGTGPFRFDSWVHGDRVELVRNGDYWGTPAKLGRLVFKAIPDSAARLNAAIAGDVDAADAISPADSKSVTSAGNLQLLPRASCNSGYVSFKSNQPPFNDPRVREAVAHAINKDALVKRFYGEFGKPAWLLMPESIPHYDSSLKNPDYNPGLAKSLLAQAGVPHPKVDFWYPTDMTRPWLPDSQGIFQAITADLEAVGFAITPKSATWTSYLSDSQTSKYAMFLLGWSCDYGTADNFYGGAFGYVGGKPNPRYAYASDKFNTALTTAETAPVAEQDAAWKQVQEIVYNDNPVVPFVHGSSVVAASTRIKGYVPNPVFVEHFGNVSLNNG